MSVFVLDFIGLLAAFALSAYKAGKSPQGSIDEPVPGCKPYGKNPFQQGDGGLAGTGCRRQPVDENREAER